MKKKFLTIALILFCLPIIGQNTFKLRHFQVNLGTTYTIPYNNSYIENRYGGGYRTEKYVLSTTVTNISSDFGYFSELNTFIIINRNISILLGFGFGKATLKFNSELSAPQRDGTILSIGKLSIQTLNLPIMIRYNPEKNIPINVATGINFGTILVAKEIANVHNEWNENSQNTNPQIQRIDYEIKQDIKPAFQYINLGLVVQLDYEFTLTKKMTGIFLTRFNYGLNDNIINKKNISVLPQKWYDHSLIVGFGIKI